MTNIRHHTVFGHDIVQLENFADELKRDELAAVVQPMWDAHKSDVSLESDLAQTLATFQRNVHTEVSIFTDRHSAERAAYLFPDHICVETKTIMEILSNPALHPFVEPIYPYMARKRRKQC